MERYVLLLVALCPLILAAGYESEIRTWRAEREKALKADNGWLTVAGLFWLKDGANTFGSAPGSDIVLPAGPAHAGKFLLEHGQVTLLGEPARELHPDSEAAADVVTIGDVTLFAIQRGGRLGIRMRDKNSQYRREFTTLHWFPVKEQARISARFVSSPGKIAILNVLGQTDNEETPGYAEFSWQGKQIRLYPTVEGNQFFFVFKDLTASKETYGAGRFLYAEMPRNGTVVLDFNKAYSPPCAFTPFATCPLPPPQNRMPVRMEAGELKYGSH